MRLSIFAAVLFQFCMPLVVSADCHVPCKTGCQTPAASCCAPVSPCGCGPAIVHAAPMTCNSCPICPKYDYANFNQQFYAEFYARNPWYLEAKKKEAAEKRKAYLAAAAKP